MNEKEKTLSICLFGANDNYTPDFLYRMGVTINFIAHSLALIDRLEDVEVLVVDWKSETPLSEALELTPQAQKICVFHYVVPKPGEKERLQVAPAVNLSLKLARGKYIANCGADTLFTFASLRALFDLFEGRTFVSEPEKHAYVCGRYTLPYEKVETHPSVEEWERYLRINSWQIEPGECIAGSFLHGTSGLFMCHRDLYNTFGGIYEGFTGAGWNDIELNVRLMSYVQTYDLRSCGVQIFDFDHHPSAGDRGGLYKIKPAHKFFKERNPNGAHWGEVDCDVVQQISNYRGEKDAWATRNVEAITFGHQSDVDLVVLKDFLSYINATSRWEGKVDQRELAVLYTLLPIMSHRPLERLLEITPSNGVTTPFLGRCRKWLEVYTVDDWPEIDDETGPHRLGIVMYQEPIAHRGAIRVLNGDVVDKIGVLKNTFDGEFGFDLSIIRETQLDFNANLEIVVELVAKCQTSVLVAETDDGFEAVLNALRATSDVIANREHKIVVTGEALDGELYIPSLQEFERTLVSSFVENDAFYPIANFHDYIANLPRDRKYVLFGYGRIGKIIYSMMKDCLVGVIDPTYSAEGNESVPLMTFDEIAQHPDATILVTPSNYNAQQLSHLSEFSNQIIGIKV